VGAIYANECQSNLALLLMILCIPIFFFLTFVFRKSLPRNVHVLAVSAIALSLLFHYSFISSYVQPIGSDILLELQVFRITQQNGHWASVLPASVMGLGRFNNMLSITILPTILSNLLNIDSVWVMKILYPIIFSLVPLVLYCFWQSVFGKRIAFISAFLFMAQETFFTEMLGLTRQMIAELFFVLLLVVILNAKFEFSKKVICLAIFGAAMVMSHYAIAVIFLFFLFATWVLARAIRKRTAITLSMVLLFSVLMFSWYIFVSGSATFDSIVQFGTYVYDELNQWANPASRGTAVLTGLGLQAAPSIWSIVSRAFAYCVELMIITGLIALLVKYRKHSKLRIGPDYFRFTVLAAILLAMLIFVPGLANTLNMTRFYHILLFFLAPLAALGAIFIVKTVLRQRTGIRTKTSVLLLAVVIPYFLFQTSFVYEVVGDDSWSIPLSKYRMSSLRLYGHFMYIDDQSISGARWLSEHVQFSLTPTYADLTARAGALGYYGITYSVEINSISNVTILPTNGTVYLDRLNVVEGKILEKYYRFNLSDISALNDSNMIYSDGGCRVYRKP